MTKLALLGPKSPHRDLGRLSGVRLEATGGLNFAGIGDAVDKARALAAQYACPVGQHYDTTLGKCVPDAEQYGPPAPGAAPPASGLTASAGAAPASTVTSAQSAPAPTANAAAGFTGPGEAPTPKEGLLARYGDLLGLHHPAQPPTISQLYAPGEAASNAAGNFVQGQIGRISPAQTSGESYIQRLRDLAGLHKPTVAPKLTDIVEGGPAAGKVAAAGVRAVTNPVNVGLSGAAIPAEGGNIAASIGRNAAANFLMGSSSQSAKEVGAPPIVQTGAGIASGLVPGLVEGGIKGVVSNITKGQAGEKAATDIPGLAESAAMTPEELKATTAASSAATPPTASTVPATPPEATAAVPGAGGAEIPPTAPSNVATLEPPPPTPPVPPTSTGGVPPSGGNADTALTKLLGAVNDSRQLPEQTEALRSAERSRRVAIAASTLEQGSRSPEAYARARAALGGELPRASFEPPADQFTPEEIQSLRSKLPQAGLRPLEEMNAETALNKVLDGRYNEIRPFEFNLMDKVYGPKLSAALSVKQLQAQGLFSRFRDGLFEYWLSNTLSGPLTQLRQFTGNLSSAVAAVPERAVSAAIEKPLAALQGRPAERFWEEAPAQAIGMMRGIPEGVRGALSVIKNGFAPADVSRIEEGGTNAIPGLLGRIVRGPLSVFEAGDALFKGINQEGNLTALAVRQARSEGLTGSAVSDRVAQLLTEPSDDLIDQATKATAYRLFRDEPTRYGQAILDARSKAPILKFILPFVRTPDRLIAFGVRRSPLGLFDVPMWQRLMKGNPEAVDELGQTLIGTTVAAGIATLAATGQIDITAGVPTNAAERDHFYREGKQPFSVKLPGVGWIQYSQIPPLNETLTNVASAVQAIKDGKDPAAIVTQTAATIGQNLLDQSYLSGLSDFLDAVSDPVRSGQRFVERQVTGLVPLSSGLRQTAQATDRTIRAPKGLGETIKAGIPGAEQSIPPRLTAFGQPSQRAFPSPVTISPDQTTAVDAELGRLGVNVGFTGKSIGGKALSREQQQAYQADAGQRTYRKLTLLLAQPFYQKLSDTLKERAITNLINQARDESRTKISLQMAQQSLKALAGH